MKTYTASAGLAFAFVGWLSASALAGPVIEDYKSRTVFGFTTSGLYDEKDEYTVGNKKYTSVLKPARVTPINNTGGDFFFDTLSAWAVGRNYTFVSAVNGLSDNSLKIHTYDVKHDATGQGVEIDIEYVPGANDPTTNVHWIQVVRNNFNITAPNAADRGPGKFEQVVDIAGTATSPYYDDGFAADSRNFYDFPSRDPAVTMFWEAELFLVTGPAPGAGGTISLYRPGLRWGWETTVEMVPAPGGLALLAGGGILAFRRRRG